MHALNAMLALSFKLGKERKELIQLASKAQKALLRIRTPQSRKEAFRPSKDLRDAPIVEKA